MSDPLRSVNTKGLGEGGYWLKWNSDLVIIPYCVVHAYGWPFLPVLTVCSLCITEEAATNRSLHDRGAHKLCSHHTRGLRGHGHGTGVGMYRPILTLEYAERVTLHVPFKLRAQSATKQNSKLSHKRQLCWVGSANWHTKSIHVHTTEWILSNDDAWLNRNNEISYWDNTENKNYLNIMCPSKFFVGTGKIEPFILGCLSMSPHWHTECIGTFQVGLLSKLFHDALTASYAMLRSDKVGGFGFRKFAFQGLNVCISVFVGGHCSGQDEI